MHVHAGEQTAFFDVRSLWGDKTQYGLTLGRERARSVS